LNAPLEFSDRVYEETLPPIVEIGQVVRIVGEIVAGADFQVVPHVAVGAEQYSGALIVGLLNDEAPKLKMIS
jgi:hypothetical protein